AGCNSGSGPPCPSADRDGRLTHLLDQLQGDVESHAHPVVPVVPLQLTTDHARALPREQFPIRLAIPFTALRLAFPPEAHPGAGERSGSGEEPLDVVPAPLLQPIPVQPDRAVRRSVARGRAVNPCQADDSFDELTQPVFRDPATHQYGDLLAVRSLRPD